MIRKLIPFILAIAVFITDQATKHYIIGIAPLPDNGGALFISDVFNNDILHIIHVRNKAIAFSLGGALPAFLKPLLFIILPVLVLLFLVGAYFKSDEWTRGQRWALAGILGGGAGNLTDRIIPPGGVPGVVDFISVKFWGLFGFERWPTFNIADSAVVVSVIFLFITFILAPKKTGGA